MIGGQAVAAATLPAAGNEDRPNEQEQEQEEPRGLERRLLNKMRETTRVEPLLFRFA
jgi:hypothetical protein